MAAKHQRFETAKELGYLVVEFARFLSTNGILANPTTLILANPTTLKPSCYKDDLRVSERLADLIGRTAGKVLR